jgi:hypothetical protein
MRMATILFGALVMFGSLACEPPDWSLDTSGKLTVKCTRKPSSGERLVLRLKVASLKDGSSLELSAPDNTHVGGVSPFGVRPGSKARYYSIPLPAKALVDDKVTLKVEVVDKSGKKERAATRTEIEDATLVFTPAAAQSVEKKQ